MPDFADELGELGKKILGNVTDDLVKIGVKVLNEEAQSLFDAISNKFKKSLSG